jgi:hypothetical protein
MRVATASILLSLFLSIAGGILCAALIAEDESLKLGAIIAVLISCVVGVVLLRRWLQLSNKALMASLVTAAIVLMAAAAYPAYVLSTVQSQIRAWENEHREETILGKSREDVVAKFGLPDSMFRNGSSRNVIVYSGPHCRVCVIEFENGAAAKVSTGMK